ncbi:lasso peptide biosynthesis B2 protein [Bacillus daqingensis]|uniref:Lasso peptide biosynthesis B2 protein n=1 Tax=Bacillus daqingensis TaxID=872396 RepID=A0ABV9NU01_9BACI
MDPYVKKLMLEAYLELARARWLKYRQHGRIQASLGTIQQETPVEDEVAKREAGSIAVAIEVMSRYAFWESECLVKAGAAVQMLKRRGMPVTVYLGTARNDAGEFVAHAWTRSGPWYITGADDVAQYTVLTTFAVPKAEEGARSHAGKTNPS